MVPEENSGQGLRPRSKHIPQAYTGAETNGAGREFRTAERIRHETKSPCSLLCAPGMVPEENSGRRWNHCP